MIYLCLRVYMFIISDLFNNFVSFIQISTTIFYYPILVDSQVCKLQHDISYFIYPSPSSLEAYAQLHPIVFS